VGRNRYADLLRIFAIVAVVYGHWLATSITNIHGELSGGSALPYVHWGEWVTLGFQVMPIFFLVGGYVNAQSWARHHALGENWVAWVRSRAMGLLWPTAVFAIVVIAAVGMADAAGVNMKVLAGGGYVVALQLWFLPVYLLLIALTPAMLAAHRRWGLWVPVVMAAGAAVVDVGVVGDRVHVIGYANYLLVWGSMHQWGFAWQDGTLNRRRWRPVALSAGGLVALTLLLTVGPFPVDMIGDGERIGNTTPPSVALLAYAAVQTGLILLAEPFMARVLERPRLWRRVRSFNPYVMTLYLWHMVPVVIISVAFYSTGVLPQPATGSGGWWALRPVWWILLTVVMVPLLALVIWAERPMLRLPAGLGSPGRWSPVLLLAGIAAAMVGLTRLAIAGFAPGGSLPIWVLAACSVGLVVTLCSGRGDDQATTYPDSRTV
jgi:hypothetical protein